MRRELQMASHRAVEIFNHSFAPTLAAGTVLWNSWPLEILVQLERWGKKKKQHQKRHGFDPLKE